MLDPSQTIRYSEAEKALIKKCFKDSPTLYALRNLFWDFELSENDKKLLNFQPDELTLIKKVFLPDIAPDIPLNQQVDFTADPLLENLHQMNPALAMIMMDANVLMEEYLTQQFRKLVNGEYEGGIVLKDLKKKLGVDQDEIRHINMLAYKSIRSYIDTRVYELRHFANPPEEPTPEQQKEKQRKDSTQ